MREIKFRVWDKSQRKFISNFLVSRIGSIMVDVGDPYTSLERRNELELSQWTGLKDKNGKEIYEGDIINGKKTNAVIEYRDGACSFKARYAPDFAPLLLQVVALQKTDGIEVIGNIYENPELLL